MHYMHNIHNMQNMNYMAVYAVCEIYAIYRQYAAYRQYAKYAKYKIYVRYAIYARWLHICEHGNTTHMHKVLGTFLNRHISIISIIKISITFCVLVLRLATLRTCNPAPPQTDWACARGLSECARACKENAFAGNVSELWTCVCLCERKAPAQAAFAAAASTATAFPAHAWAMILPRAAKGRDPPVSTAGVIGSPCSAHSSSLSLEIISSTFALNQSDSCSSKSIGAWALWTWWEQTEQAQETPLELAGFMGRQRVTDDQITMVQSQKFQQFLTRVSAFAGTHQFWAIVGQRRKRSKIFSRKSIESLYFARFFLVHKHPPVERKWQLEGN